LIVDDDQAILETLKKILECEGYKVDVAVSGREALSKLRSRFFNLVILDIKLPDMEGMDLLEKMNSLEKIVSGIKTIKIMMTGFSSEDYAIKSLNLGADAYLVKPVNPKNILETIKSQINKQEEYDANNKLEIRKEKSKTAAFLKYYD